MCVSVSVRVSVFVRVTTSTKAFNWLRSVAGSHDIDFQVFDAKTATLLHRARRQFHVVQPPRVSLVFPAPGQDFVCDGAVTLTFAYATDYEPTADFYEMGAGYHGAAVFVNDERGTISDLGFVTTRPIPYGVYQLRVALFDYSGNEINASSSALLAVSVSPPPLPAVNGSVGRGCQMVWLTRSDARDTALAALSSAAKPWLENDGSGQTEQGGGGAHLWVTGAGFRGVGEGKVSALESCALLVVPESDKGLEGVEFFEVGGQRGNVWQLPVFDSLSVYALRRRPLCLSRFLSFSPSLLRVFFLPLPPPPFLSPPLSPSRFPSVPIPSLPSLSFFCAFSTTSSVAQSSHHTHTHKHTHTHTHMQSHTFSGSVV